MLTGLELIAKRRKRGWTQAQAAGHLGISQTYLSMLEADRRPVTPRLFDRLRRVYVLGPLSLPFLDRVDTNPTLTNKNLAKLRARRSSDARRWNLLSGIRIEQLREYVVPDYH